MRRKWIALILLLALVSSVYAQDSIDIGDTVEDELNGGTNEYVFEAEAGVFLEVSLESRDFDTLLLIVNEAGDEVARDDDSGEESNSLLSFIVPETGSYTIQATSFGRDASGSFVLRLKEQAITSVNFGEEVPVEFAGSDILYFSFSGTEGQAVNISVDTNGELDSVLTLKQNGAEVARDDDSGEGLDPYIRQKLLPAEGLYVIEVAPLSGNELEGKATLLVEETELLSLDDEVTQSLTFTQESALEVLTFTAESDTDYLLSVETDETTNLTFEVYVDDSLLTTVNASSTNRLSFGFAPEDSGTGTIRVSSTFYDEEDVELQLKLERIAD